MSFRNFLGFMVNNKGIEANLENIEALQDFVRITNLKDLQKLTGIIITLNKFISECSDMCKPFFKALKKSQVFLWDEECDKALANLKNYLSSPPLISILKPYE